MKIRPVVSYPREAVVDAQQLAAALGVNVMTAKRHNFYDLPASYLHKQPRWVWGQVLDVLQERAA